jgi:murein L,D-transpeptidase YcbB/YkuD
VFILIVFTVFGAYPLPRFARADSVGQVQTTVFMSPETVDFLSEKAQLLQCLGYFPTDVDPTGYFGPVTEAAVRGFQSAYGIDPAGYVGHETRALLNAYR